MENTHKPKMQTLKDHERLQQLTIFENTDPSYWKTFTRIQNLEGSNNPLRAPNNSKPRYYQTQDPCVKRWKDASQKSSLMADFFAKK